MQLAEKVAQLDETNLEAQPHLRALLASVSHAEHDRDQADTHFRRKKEFELHGSGLTSGPASLNTFPQMLLQDVDGSTSFLTCVVEVFHL